jgi:cold shock CspA family protein
MQLPLEITFRGVQKNEAVENLIHKKIERLERICDYITSCRVVVESRQEHQRTGSPFRLRIFLAVPPGHDVVVQREETQGHVNEDLPMVVRDAFQAAERQLKELVEKQRGQVKTHPEQERVALVDKLFPEEGYGFIKTPEERVLYFHRNAVLGDDFDRLEIGTGVRYVEELGEEGPQASTLQIIDKPGSRTKEAESEV